MMKVFLITVILGLAFSGMAWAEGNGLSLEKVEGKRVGNNFETYLTFTGAPNEKEVALEYSDSSITLAIPNATAPRDGNTFEFTDPEISIVSYDKLPNNSIRVTLHLTPQATGTLYREKSVLVAKGNTLTFTATPTVVAAAPVPISAPTNTVDAKKDIEKDISKVQEAAEEAQPIFAAKEPSINKATAPQTTGFGKKVLVSVIAITLFGAGAYFAIRRWPSKKPRAKPHMIKVISQAHLGPKRSVAVIRVAGEHILVGVTDHSVNHIKTLAILDEEIPDSGAQQFEKALARKASYEEQDEIPAPADLAAQDVEDEFTIKGLHNLVGDKLKNLRSF